MVDTACCCEFSLTPLPIPSLPKGVVDTAYLQRHPPSPPSLLYNAYIEGWCRGAIRLNLLPKAAHLEGRGRGVVRLNLLPKAAHLEGRCRGGRPLKFLAEGRMPRRTVSASRLCRVCIHLLGF